MPRISVVIPLYNHERYIRAALESLFSQTAPPAEIIVIDDGSTDGSAEQMRQICRDHQEIIFWSWPNRGAHHTLNAAIHRATGDYITILNSDDFYDPKRLAACLAIAESDPSIDVVATGVSFVDGEGAQIENPWYDDAVAYYRQVGELSLALFHANFLVTTSNLFIRRSVFERIGYFAPLRYTHDLEFMLRLASAGRNFHFLDSPLVAYRVHGANTIGEDRGREDIERATVYAFFMHRQYLQGKADSSVIDRHVEALGKQDLLESVEYFLDTLHKSRRQTREPAQGPLSAAFLEYAEMLGTDWLRRELGDPMLDRFIAARNSFLEHRKKEDIARTEHVTALNAQIAWLTEQRDAWEKTAAAAAENFARQENQLKALHQELTTTHQELTATHQELTTTRQELTTTRQEFTTTRQELTTTRQELDKHRETLTTLLRSRLFRALLRIKLLRLSHDPRTSTEDG